MSAVVIGSVNDRSDASVHIRTSVSTCRIITRLADDGTRVARRAIVNTTRIKAANVCRWCATPENLAAAERANKFGVNWSAVVEKFLANLGPQGTLNPAGYNVEHDEERAEIAARWAEHNAPVEPVKPSFASVLANLGGRHNGAHYDHAARRLARRHLANAA